MTKPVEKGEAVGGEERETIFKGDKGTSARAEEVGDSAMVDSNEILLISSSPAPKYPPITFIWFTLESTDCSHQPTPYVCRRIDRSGRVPARIDLGSP